MNWMPKNASRLNVIIVAVIAVDFVLWGLFLLVRAWQEGILAMTAPGPAQVLFFNISFLGVVFISSRSRYDAATKRPFLGHELFTQARKDANHASHRQAVWIFWLQSFCVVLMMIDLLLGYSWQSRFYLVYAVVMVVFLFSVWQEARLSDRLVQRQ
jgi:hypothetical protein